MNHICGIVSIPADCRVFMISECSKINWLVVDQKFHARDSHRAETSGQVVDVKASVIIATKQELNLELKQVCCTGQRQVSGV